MIPEWQRLAAQYFEQPEQTSNINKTLVDVAAIKADIAQLKAEQAKSRADQKAKLQTKIDNLNKKLQVKIEQAKLRAEQREKEAKTKLEALEKKAAKAKGEAKAKIEARIADIKENEKKSSEDFNKWLNGEM